MSPDKCFVATNIGFSRQTFCLDKQTFVATKDVLVRQKFCREKDALVRQKFCRDKHAFVATKDVFCRDKHVFVATKIIFMATPANDTGRPPQLSHSSWALTVCVHVQCCLKSTETVRTVRDGEPRTATSTFTQFLGSDVSASKSRRFISVLPNLACFILFFYFFIFYLLFPA